MNQFDEIKNRQHLVAENISKSFINNDLDKSENLNIEKAKAVPVGTKNKYGEVKQQDGTWKYEKKSSTPYKSEKKETSSEYKTGDTIKQGDKSYKKQSNGKWLEISEKGLTKKEHLLEYSHNKSVKEKGKHGLYANKLSDKEHSDEDLGLTNKPTSKLDINIKQVQDWAGSDFSEDHIISVSEQLDDAGISPKDLRVSKSGSLEKFNKDIQKKVEELKLDLREGLAHKDLSDRDVKDILWGILMSKNN